MVYLNIELAQAMAKDMLTHINGYHFDITGLSLAIPMKI